MTPARATAAIASLALGLSLSGARPAFADADDETCRRWGAVPGTPAYFECRATVERQRAGGGGAAAPAPKPEVIGDGLALEICDKKARSSSRYPILNRATSNVSGGHEKRVSIAYKIEKPGTAVAFMNVDCLLRGKELLDIRMNQ